MRLLVCVWGCVVVVGISAVAQPSTIKGTLIDNACRLEGVTREQLAKHDKGCLQMGVCATTGYAVVTEDDKFYTFDANGNTLAIAEIEQATRQTDFKVTVSGEIKGNTVAVTSLAIDK